MTKKIIKPLAIATAVYFTGGLALSAFGPTQAFAASLPGFAGGGWLGTGIGGTAGEGIFTKAASAIGLGGGLEAGAAAKAASSAALPSVFSAAPAAETSLEASSNFLLGKGAQVGAQQIPKELAKSAAMSLTDKLLLAKIGTDVTGALFGPTPQEEWEAQAVEQAKFRGSYYGLNDQEINTMMAGPPSTPPPQAAPPPQSQAGDYSESITPEQQQLLAGREKRELFPKRMSQSPGQTTGPGQMQQQLNVPEGIFAPGENVRYV